MDTAHTLKEIVQELKKIRSFPSPEDEHGNLLARVDVNGCDYASIENGLVKIARTWFSQRGDFIKSKCALGLGLDIYFNSEYATIYAAARFF